MATYTTIQGDTWDMIAYRKLGSERYMNQLMRLNQAHLNTVFFPAGVVLTLPVIEEPASSKLPPWKR